MQELSLAQAHSMSGIDQGDSPWIQDLKFSAWIQDRKYMIIPGPITVQARLRAQQDDVEVLIIKD